MKTFLPDQTRISQVHLRTANLEGALAFYSEVLGLKALRESGPCIILSAATDGSGTIALSENCNALRGLPRSTGLHHFALRYPGRQELAQAYCRVVKSGYAVAGASDHGVSEAIYLCDPDGNGVALYVDRPRAQWPWRDGQIATMTQALNLDSLLATAANHSVAARPPLPAAIGHIHLQVADLAEAERFYCEFLGFAVTQRSCPGARFFTAGPCHHHIGVNVWVGQTLPPAPSVGLISYRLEVPVTEILYCLGQRAPLLGYETRTRLASDGTPTLLIRDLNGNWLEIQPSPTAISFKPTSRCRAGSETAGMLH